jgi:HK97 gp10 family phage protein
MSVKQIGPLFDGRLFRNIVTEEISAVERAGSLVLRNAKKLAPVGKPSGKRVTLKKSMRFSVKRVQASTAVKAAPSFFPSKEEKIGEGGITAKFFSVWYTHFPERGTVKQRAQYFLRRAMKVSRPVVRSLMTQGVNRALARSIAKESGG